MPKSKLDIIFHNGLTKRPQPVQVTMLSDLRWLKAKNSFLVDLRFADGSENSYWCENDKCKEPFVGRVGQTFSVVFEGYKESAVVTFVGGPAGQAQQPPPAQQAQQPQQTTQPPQQVAKPAQQQRQESPDPVRAARHHVARNRSLGIVALQATYTAMDELTRWYRARFNDPVWVPHPTTVNTFFQSCLYGCQTNGIPAHDMPTSLTFPEVKAGQTEGAK